MEINTISTDKKEHQREHQPGHGFLELEVGVRNVPFAWLMTLQEALCAQHCVLHAYAYGKLIHFSILYSVLHMAVTR